MILLALPVAWGCEADYSTSKDKQGPSYSKTSDGDVESHSIRWNEPIDSEALGLEPNPRVDGRTLASIISGKVAGRSDGKLCSSCHNQDGDPGGYGVDVEENGALAKLKPKDLVGGKTWAGRDGWAAGFIENDTKPDNLKAIIRAWIDNDFR
jgi:hypothetical protein